LGSYGGLPKSAYTSAKSSFCSAAHRSANFARHATRLETLGVAACFNHVPELAAPKLDSVQLVDVGRHVLDLASLVGLYATPISSVRNGGGTAPRVGHRDRLGRFPRDLVGRTTKAPRQQGLR
jgi:hypothetical protein